MPKMEGEQPVGAAGGGPGASHQELQQQESPTIQLGPSGVSPPLPSDGAQAALEPLVGVTVLTPPVAPQGEVALAGCTERETIQELVILKRDMRNLK